jgi:RNA polymerase sigma-70 factor (ECF subfamily)
VHGVDRGLDLDGMHLLHAVRADLLRRLGRHGEAARAYDAAVERAANAAERAFLRRRRAALPDGPGAADAAVEQAR